MGYARIIVLTLAALAAGVAAFLVQGLIVSNKRSAPVAAKPDASLTQVLVASKDLQLGTKLTPQDMQWQAWPQTAATGSYITKSGSPDAVSESSGAIVRQAMLTGEPVTQNKIVRADGTGFMAAMLTAGMRAVSVKISAETGAGGFILPNDRVDVILTSQSDDNRSRSSRTILSSVRVLAIDQTYREEGDKSVVIGKTATLELAPGQTEALARAEASGTVSLALRSLADYDPKADNDRPGTVGAMTVIRYGNATEVNVNGAAQ